MVSRWSRALPAWRGGRAGSCRKAPALAAQASASQWLTVLDRMHLLATCHNHRNWPRHPPCLSLPTSIGSGPPCFTRPCLPGLPGPLGCGHAAARFPHRPRRRLSPCRLRLWNTDPSAPCPTRIVVAPSLTPGLQIAEEQPLQLDAAMPGGQKAGDVLVPRLLGLLGAPSPDLRALAVSTLNQLSNVMPPALLDSMDRWGRPRGCEPGRGEAWASLREEAWVRPAGQAAVRQRRRRPSPAGLARQLLLCNQPCRHPLAPLLRAASCRACSPWRWTRPPPCARPCAWAW